MPSKPNSKEPEAKAGRTMWCRQAISVFTLLAVCSNSRGERVGFEFTGALQGGSTGTYSLFGINIPRNSPIAGTFSYDTTTEGIEAESGTRKFPQFIHGGYNLDINNGAIRLSASDYVVTVADDYQRMPEAVDLISIDFDSRNKLMSAPILVNGEPWTGPTAFLKVELSWPASAFEGADEPKLASDRPLGPDPGVSAFVGSTVVPRLLLIDAISAIAPLVGDYNRDGKQQASDYAEWRRAFGKAGESYLYADGNKDGVVDVADYVVFRHASGHAVANSAIPEPRGFTLTVTGAVWFAAWAFNRHSLLYSDTSRRRSWKRVEPSH
jgi:hypothetical protein